MVSGRVTMHIRARGPVPDVEQRLREALQEEGLGIITEVDLESKIAERLGEQVGPYRLLGACAPDLAHRAISAWKGFGVFLPCTIALYEAGQDTAVEAANPLELPGVANNAVLAEVAREAHQRLERVLRRLEQDGS